MTSLQGVEWSIVKTKKGNIIFYNPKEIELSICVNMIASAMENELKTQQMINSLNKEISVEMKNALSASFLMQALQSCKNIHKCNGR